MKQVGRNLTNAEDGFLNGKRYLIMDRDGKFCPAFKDILAGDDINPVLLPPKSPNLNSHLERFFLSLKSECLLRMIFFGETSLRNAVGQFLLHYHGERNHQGLENEIIEPGEEFRHDADEIECRERLGGLLRYYHRRAAERSVGLWFSTARQLPDPRHRFSVRRRTVSAENFAPRRNQNQNAKELRSRFSFLTQRVSSVSPSSPVAKCAPPVRYAEVSGELELLTSLITTITDTISQAMRILNPWRSASRNRCCRNMRGSSTGAMMLGWNMLLPT